MNARPDPNKDTMRLEETSTVLAEWFETDAPPQEPAGLLNATLYRTARTRRRAWWLDPEGLFPTTLIAHRSPMAAPMRAVLALLLVALLALALAAGGAIVGSRLSSRNDPDDGRDTLPAVALLPTGCPAGATLKSGDIATVAGTGVDGITGDDGPALSATLSAPYGIAIDPTGAIYVGNSAGYFGRGVSHGVRRIGPDGIITTATLGPTSTTTFKAPTGVAFDTQGILYVTDYFSARIWRIDPTGTSVPVVGTGVDGSDGEAGPALSAKISASNLAFGPTGEIYFDDWTQGWHKVDTAGIVRPFAGNGLPGFSGDGGQATLAQVSGGSDPVALAVDLAGNVYLPDPNNHRIRKVDRTGIITTFAGNGLSGHAGDGGPAIDAAIGRSNGIAVDAAGNVYFSSDNQTVRRVDTGGSITTLAGTGSKAGFSGDCGPALDARLSEPNGVAVHDGVLYIVDAGNDRIRMVVL